MDGWTRRFTDLGFGGDCEGRGGEGRGEGCMYICISLFDSFFSSSLRGF